MTEIDDLIQEMQLVKQNHATLSISEILRIFSIQAMKALTNEIRRMNANG